MTDAARNVLLTFGAPVMWDASRVGSGLSLSVGGVDADGRHTVQRTGSSGTTSAITSRPLQGSWVCVIKITALPSGTVAVGVRKIGARRTRDVARLANATYDQAKAAGAYTGSYGITSAGIRYTQGATASTGVTWAVNDRFVVRFNDVTGVLTIAKNDGAAVATWTGLRGPFELIGTPLTNGTALTLISDIDDVPWTPTYRPAGVWARMALIGWTSPSSDTVCRNRYFDGRIASDSEPSYDIVACVPLIDGDRPTRPTGDFELNNADRALAHWQAWQTRDEPLTIHAGTMEQTFSAFELVASCRIDTINVGADEHRVRVTPRDAAVVLEVPWSASRFPSTGVPDSLQNVTMPTAIGTLYNVPLTLTDASNLRYVFSDDAVFGVSALYDKGVALTLGAGYEINSTRTGVRRLTNPDGRQCATIVGNVTSSTVHIDALYGDFTPWAGSPAVPAGWDRGFTGGTSTVTNASPGARFLSNGAGGTFASLHRQFVFATTAMNLRIDITVVVTSGSLNIRITDFGANFIDTNVSASGTYTFYVSKPIAAPHIQIFTPFIAADVTVTRLRIDRAEALDTLGNWMRHLVTERGPLSMDDIDTASVAAVAAARPWPLCLYTAPGDGTQVIDVLDQTVRSLCAGWYVMPTGKIALFVLNLAASPAMTLTDVEIVGPITCEPCTPEGLSDRAAGMPNWSVHADGDIAGSLLTTSAGRAFAEGLKSTHLATRIGASQLASCYASAMDAEPIDSILATAAGTQSLADAATAFFAVPRNIYKLAAQVDGTPPLPGSVIVVQSDAHDLQAGKPLAVLGRGGVHSNNLATFTLIG